MLILIWAMTFAIILSDCTNN